MQDCLCAMFVRLKASRAGASTKRDGVDQASLYRITTILGNRVFEKFTLKCSECG